MHMNVSPDSIFLESDGIWKLSPPDWEHINLKIRLENGENIGFLIPKEIYEIEYNNINS